MAPTNFLPEPYQANTSNDNAQITEEDLSYFRHRIKNMAFQSLMAKFVERAESDGFTKALIATRLGKDRAQITRLFAGPTNWTLDTLSDLALALDLEPEVTFESLREDPRHNFCHSWMASFGAGSKFTDIEQLSRVGSTVSSSNFEVKYDKEES